MGATLPGCAPSGFSKTARSHPCLREAGRDRAEVGRLPAIPARRLPDELGEGPRERAEAAKADVEADLGDAPIRLPQQEHRPLDTSALEVAMRRLAVDGAESADE